MKHLTHLLIGVLVAPVMLAFGTKVMAQEKTKAEKAKTAPAQETKAQDANVLFENERLRVTGFSRSMTSPIRTKRSGTGGYCPRGGYGDRRARSMSIAMAGPFGLLRDAGQTPARGRTCRLCSSSMRPARSSRALAQGCSSSRTVSMWTETATCG